MIVDMSNDYKSNIVNSYITENLCTGDKYIGKNK